MSVNIFQLLVCCYVCVQCSRQQVGHNRKQGRQEAARGGRRRQEAAGGGQLEKLEAAKAA